MLLSIAGEMSDAADAGVAVLADLVGDVGRGGNAVPVGPLAG